MCFLSSMEAKLPLGFRFNPRDDELISDYLASRVSGDRSGFPGMIIDVELHKCEPWNLPEMACVGGKEWYFYCLRGHKYASGKRTNRATASGYWKATGKDRPVVEHRRGGLVGMRKTLVFYLGRSAKGKKTDWIMHEFRMVKPAAGGTGSFPFMEDWVLCRVFHKTRGLQYSKSGTGNSHDKCAPSLHLMDPCDNCEQDHLNVEGCDKLSCFSTHPPTPALHPRQRSPTASSHIWPAEQDVPQTADSFAHLGTRADMAAFDLSPLSYEGMAIEELLNHLPKSYGDEGSSATTYLSQPWEAVDVVNHPS